MVTSRERSARHRRRRAASTRAGRRRDG